MFGNKTKQQLKALQTELNTLKEATRIPVGGVQVDPDEHLFRSLTATNRDLTPITQERMINIAVYLYDTNLMAARIVEIIRDYVIGSGVTYTCDSEDAKAVIDDFWTDPINNWPLYQSEAVIDLCVYGEQCWPVFVDENTGKVRLGYVDPGSISKVITDPGNVKLPIAVKLKRCGGQKARALKVVLRGEDESLLTKDAIAIRDKFKDGSCFLFQINKLTAASRGRSDLFRPADWLDGYDQMLFNVLERPEHLNNYVWDVKLEGMSDPDIQAWLSKQKSPKPGSLRAHNEKVEWTAVAPDLKGADTEKTTKIIKNHILGAKGIPAHWFGSDGDVNRASAAEMGDPTYKMLNHRRTFFHAMLEQIFDYVLDQAVSHGTLKQLPAGEEYECQITMPEFVPKDVTKYSAALQQISQSITLMISQGLLTREDAIKILAIPINQIGHEIDVDKQIDEATGDAFKDFEDVEDKKQADALKEAYTAISKARTTGGFDTREATRITENLINRLNIEN